MEDLEEIEKYWENKMTPREKSDFERRLLLEPDLQEELELYKNVIAGIKDSGKEEELRLQLKKADTEMDTSVPMHQPVKNKKKFVYYGVAASIALLLGISYLLMKHSTNGTLAKFEENDIGLPVLMGNSGNVEFSKGMSFYKQNKYDSALCVFNKLAVVAPSDTLIYYSGVIYYEKGDYMHAIANFQETIDHYPSGVFYNKARYRLGLTLWHEDKRDEAKKVFISITADNNSPYSDKAKEILKVLYPDRIIYIEGSDKKGVRTRMYQRKIYAHFDEISKLFYIYGLKDGNWQLYTPNINYNAFLIRKKNI